jgi:hypothetical protein
MHRYLKIDPSGILYELRIFSLKYKNSVWNFTVFLIFSFYLLKY